MLHCHGVVVRHEGGSVECADGSCPGDLVLHDFVVDCAELGARCCEIAAGALPGRRAG